MKQYTTKSVKRALDSHIEGGLILGWRQAQPDQFIITTSAGRDFRVHGLREAYVFVNALASAAQAVDEGTAKVSEVAQVRQHLESTGQLARDCS